MITVNIRQNPNKIFSLNDCYEYVLNNIKDIKSINDTLKKNIDEFYGLHNDKILSETRFRAEIKKCFSIKKNMRIIHIEYWTIRGYSIIEAKEKISEIQKNRSKRSIKYWLNRGYSDTEANKKVSEFQKKPFEKWKSKYTEDELRVIFRKNSIRCIEYWVNKGYSEYEAKEQIHKICDNSIHIDYKNIIGTTSIQYFLNKGYSEEDAKNLLKNRQSTFSLKRCIEKYGAEEGKKTWQERQDKWQNTLQSKENYDEIVKKRTKRFGKISKESLKIFIPLYKNLRRLGFKRNDILFGISGNKELRLDIPQPNKKKCYYYDFTILPLNLIIEYHGIAFHTKSLNDNRQIAYHDSKEKWFEDRKKIQFAEESGFLVKEYWSDEKNILNRINAVIEKLIGHNNAIINL